MEIKLLRPPLNTRMEDVMERGRMTHLDFEVKSRETVARVKPGAKAVARLEVETDKPRAPQGLFRRVRRAVRGLFEVDFPEDAIPEVDQPCSRERVLY